MNRYAAGAIAAGYGAVAGCLYLAVLVGSAGGLMLVYMTQLPLFVAGLWLGTTGAALAGLTAALLLFAAGDLLAAALFVALNAAPVTLLVRQALLARSQQTPPEAPQEAPQEASRQAGAVQWYPPGLLAAWLAGMALLGIAAALVTLGGPAGMQAELRDTIGGALQQLATLSGPERDELAGGLALVAPGIVAASWMVMAVVNGALAQGLVVRFGVNWRPTPELSRLVLPLWLPLLLTAAAVASGFGGTPRFLGVNAMIVLLVPFTLAGLAALHRAARRVSHPLALLIAFYAFAAVLGWPFLAVAILGLFETWLGLRRRLIRPGEPSHG